MAVGAEDDRGLEVIEGRDDARAEEPERGGGRAPLEVDEDPVDGIRPRHPGGKRDDLVDEPRVDPDPAEDRDQPVHGETSRQHVGVERVDERIGLPVVAEEQLPGVGRRVEPPAQQLDQLEGERSLWIQRGNQDRFP